MPAVTDQITPREAALVPLLQAVRQSVEAWAKKSTDGATVWEVGVELLGDLDFDWGYARRAAVWTRPHSLISVLENIGAASRDDDVKAYCQAAQTALAAYHEL